MLPLCHRGPHLALVEPTQDRWTKLQEMFHRLSMKSIISARTLMSTIGLLASMEKTVNLGRMHMRPFQWHLKTHWKYLVVRPSKCVTRRTSPPQGTQKPDLYTSNAGWGAHSGQNSTGGLWSLSKKHLHINLLETKVVFLAL